MRISVPRVLDAAAVILGLVGIVLLGVRFFGDDDKPVSIGCYDLEPLGDRRGPALVFVVDPKCTLCSANAGLYALLRSSTARRSRVEFVVAVPNKHEATLAYVRSIGLVPDRVIEATARELGLLGTPALLAVTSDGDVQRAWMGVIEPGEHETVIRQIASLDRYAQEGGPMDP